MNREALVEAVTREVLAALAIRNDVCDTGEKVREVVANGADRVAFHGEAAEVPLDMARFIDHTLLKPEATAEIDQLCREAEQYHFASVCINPTWVKRAAENLRGTSVPVCTVVDSRSGPPLPRSRRWRRGGRCVMGPGKSTWCSTSAPSSRVITGWLRPTSKGSSTLPMTAARSARSYWRRRC